MEIKQHKVPANLRRPSDDIIEIAIGKWHFEHRRTNAFLPLCTIALPPCPTLTEPSQQAVFRFKAHQWQEAKRFLDERMIPYEMVRYISY
jgi:hypothetical protein